MNDKKIMKYWNLVDVVKVFFLWIIVSVIVSIGLIFFKIENDRIIINYVSTIMLLFIPIIYINKVYGLNIESLGWRPKEFLPKHDIFIGLAVGIMLFLLSTGLNYVWKLVNGSLNDRIILNSEHITKLIFFYILAPIAGFLQVILKPFAEEVFFRGFLLPPLKRMLKNVTMSLVLNGLLFSLLHFDYFSQDAAFLLITRFVIGVVLAYLYNRYNRLFPCVIAHSATIFLNMGIRVLYS